MCAHALALGALAALILTAGPIGAQTQAEQPARTDLPLLMIVSQPGALDRRADFVDMGFFLARSLQESGRFAVVVYSPQQTHVTEAVKAGRLTQADAGAYLTEAGAQKVAEAIGAVYIVRVTAMRTRQGIGANADMQMRVGGSRWSTFFTTTMVPYTSRNRKTLLLEAIHAHVGAIVPRIVAAPPIAPANVAASSETPQPAKTERETPPTQPPAQGTPTAADMLVDRFRRSGDTASLILTLRRAINERPREARLRRELVAALRMRGWTEAARDEAARGLLICPGDAGLHRLLGDGHLDMGQIAEALAEYREAVRLEPANPANHIALGDALTSQAQVAEAEAAYKAAQEADPKSPLPRLRIARMRAQALRFQDLVAEMTEARKMVGDGDDAVYATAYAEIVGILDGAARDVIGRLVAIRRDQISGTRNREESHKAAETCRATAAGISDCFSAMPPPQRLGTIQSPLVQAASLLAQAASAYLSFLETQSDADDKEATLLRQEAARQFEETAKRLSALMAPPAPAK
jgi:tetratricopeptide (TPR) repeat protein